MNPATAHLVRPSTVERIVQAAQRLGYVPNGMARSLRTNRTHSLGFAIPDIANPVFPSLIRGFEDVVAAKGYISITGNTDNDPQRQRQQIIGMRARQVDGLAVATPIVDRSDLDPMLAGKVPVVLVHQSDPLRELSSVTSDDLHGIRQAVDHLVALGHRVIAHVAGPLSTPISVVRLQGYRAALQAHGIAVEEELIAIGEQFRPEDGAEQLAALLDRRPDVTAVVTASDLLAIGCVDLLRSRGLSCPDDVSVVGYNDLFLVDRIDPPLTSVRVPHYEVGAAAARTLLACIAEPGRAPTAELLPTQLIVRGSTGAPRVSSRR